MLEMLEDRLTPSGNPLGGPLAPAPLPATDVNSAAQALTFTFTPDRLVYPPGVSSININLKLTDASTGASITNGTVTFTVTDLDGHPEANPLTAAVSSDGQVSVTYPLPTNLAPYGHLVMAVYHNPGSPFDGATGSEYLSLIPLPAPAQQPSPPPTQPPTPPGTPPPPSPLQAALTLYFDGILLELDQMAGLPSADVQASINANMPYAGPWGGLFELAGELAVMHATQKPGA
jgi:hypothetical protein